MATLQKFKLLAQCATAAAPSPSSSPTPAATASPAFRLRRRRSLRRLLGRTSSRLWAAGRGVAAPAVPSSAAEDVGERKGLHSHKLRDLFVSSPPPPPAMGGGREGIREAEGGDGSGEGGAGGFWSEIGSRGGTGRRFGSEGIVGRRIGGGGGLRFGSPALRYRLLRKAWRPVLVTIPE